MIAFCNDTSFSSWTTPSGWTSLGVATSSGGAHTAVFAKVADSTDAAAASFTFTFNTTARISATLYALSGTFTSSANIYTSILEAAADQGSGVLRATTGITPSVANSLLIMHFFAFYGSAPSTNNFSAYTLQTNDPGTWTETIDGGTATVSKTDGIASAYATRTQTTATGYFQVTSVLTSFSANFLTGVLLAITDSQDTTQTPSVITAATAVQQPGVGGGVSTAVIQATITMQAPSVAAVASKWQNTSKSSAGSITNTPKS